MARHRVIAFDDPRHFGQRGVIPTDDPRYPAIRRRRIETWLMTLGGFFAMGALIFAALWVFDFSYRLQFGFGLLWLFLPVVMWWFCAKIALAITKSVPADPNNPEHKRVLDALDRVYAKSGMKFKPPLYYSPNPLPNAFATGPIHRKAVVAFTEGFTKCGFTDEEIEAVFGHELGHVYNYDVGINSTIAVLSSLFFLITESGVRALLGSINIFRRIFGLAPTTRFLPGILFNVVMYVIFTITGQITKIVQLFVVRSRESGADATGAYFTGNPCALSTALQKLVAYVMKNRPKMDAREAEMYRVFRPIMIVDPLFDTLTPEPTSGGGIWGAIKRLWKYLQLTHPPVPERVAQLDRMNGGACPRIPHE
jgi:Zn-dependent protease with chaperone function